MDKQPDQSDFLVKQALRILEMPYKEETELIKVPIETERKRVTTGDTPYADYFGGARKDTVHKKVMRFKNMCGNDLILFLFNKKAIA